MAMHSMMETSCLNNVTFIHPILHALFTFLQMHFLFVNSQVHSVLNNLAVLAHVKRVHLLIELVFQVLVEKFGLVARFGFMHLAATNMALWIKLIILETGLEWIYFVYLAQSNIFPGIASPFESDIPTPLQLKGFPRFLSRHHVSVPAYGENLSLGKNVSAISHTNKFPFCAGYNLSLNVEELYSNTYKPISDGHIKQIVTLHYCMNTNSLGQLWTSSMPFLYPFIIQFR